jgi:starch phosphorylase
MDVQVKRIHEYKRQHLNVLHVIALYRRLKREPGLDLLPRTVLFAGKAAPGYVMAKRIIRLIHRVGEVVNADPETRDRLRVVFLPDYNVKHSMRIFPGADLSEQISTAGKEASGTGNMKFALNGALTIGTLDGANVEIRECVGADNFFLFGMTVQEVARLQGEGYRPSAVVERDPELHEVLESLASGAFARGDQAEIQAIVDNLLHDDPFLVLADFRAYVACQRQVEQAWRDREAWSRASILNVARSAFFSSDRAIRTYARDIWDVKPVPVPES